jgi:hypothetical protein
MNENKKNEFRYSFCQSILNLVRKEYQIIHIRFSHHLEQISISSNKF